MLGIPDWYDRQLGGSVERYPAAGLAVSIPPVAGSREYERPDVAGAWERDRSSW